MGCDFSETFFNYNVYTGRKVERFPYSLLYKLQLTFKYFKFKLNLKNN